MVNKLRFLCKQEYAFTLAEVLITLVIIGVVAAIATPIVLNKYKTRQYYAGAMKAYSALNQMASKYYIDNGELPRCAYPSDYTSAIYLDDCNLLYNYFVKSMMVMQHCEKDAYTKGCIPDYKGIDTATIVDGATGGCSGFSQASIRSNSAIVTSDGMIYIPYQEGDTKYPVYMVDVNGHKGPNKFGSDIHFFTVVYNASNKSFEKPVKFAPGSVCAFYEKNGYKTEKLLLDDIKYDWQL
ncbi:prepilin-type N-terminal cleavage/methylation domain-containing protein [bacterium]|nr:prepilin-type N-terminal cleavage/methylation domain-containing protein [bacterium]